MYKYHQLTTDELSEALDELWAFINVPLEELSEKTKETAKHNHWHKADICPGDIHVPGDFVCNRRKITIRELVDNLRKRG